MKMATALSTNVNVSIGESVNMHVSMTICLWCIHSVCIQTYIYMFRCIHVYTQAQDVCVCVNVRIWRQMCELEGGLR